MSEPTEEHKNPPHISGPGLLHYLRGSGLDINLIQISRVPRALLEYEGEKVTVNFIVATLLLEDEDGKLARRFAGKCLAYKNNEPCKKVDSLKRQFQKFIGEVLRDKKIITPHRNTLKKTMRVKMGALDAHHEEIHSLLDTWDKNFSKLLGVIADYITLLEYTYVNPRPDSWREDDDYHKTELVPAGVSDSERRVEKYLEHIPDNYLNIFGRIFAAFQLRVSLSANIIQSSRRGKKRTRLRDELLRMRKIISYIRTLRWQLFSRYQVGDFTITTYIENTLNIINGILSITK